MIECVLFSFTYQRVWASKRYILPRVDKVRWGKTQILWNQQDGEGGTVSPDPPRHISADGGQPRLKLTVEQPIMET
jgi:hypothetical protein